MLVWGTRALPTCPLDQKMWLWPFYLFIVCSPFLTNPDLVGSHVPD